MDVKLFGLLVRFWGGVMLAGSSGVFCLGDADGVGGDCSCGGEGDSDEV